MESNMTPLSPSEMLNQLNDNVSVAFKLFDEKVGKYKDKAVYCFVEGYDMPYYSPRIESLTDKDSEFIDCGGKKGVIGTHSFLSTKPAYKQYITLYFVDKDYDDNHRLSADIFITDGYSVENYYASDKAIKKALKGICNVKAENEAGLDIIIEWYQDWKRSFVKATRLFCSWYAATKDRPDRRIEDRKYKKSFPDKYASISSKGITATDYTLDDLNKDYGIKSPVSQEELDSILMKINS
ncbi:MAG: DUF4435 domain-containing protein, partial [Muribaculaceae bacterium]|nr:DUF4435 domain-containing protein [Muribaculaceae bacterium]